MNSKSEHNSLSDSEQKNFSYLPLGTIVKIVKSDGDGDGSGGYARTNQTGDPDEQGPLIIAGYRRCKQHITGDEQNQTSETDGTGQECIEIDFIAASEKALKYFAAQEGCAEVRGNLPIRLSMIKNVPTIQLRCRDARDISVIVQDQLRVESTEAFEQEALVGSRFVYLESCESVTSTLEPKPDSSRPTQYRPRAMTAASVSLVLKSDGRVAAGVSDERDDDNVFQHGPVYKDLMTVEVPSSPGGIESFWFNVLQNG